MKTIFDNEVPGTRFEHVMTKIQNFVFRFVIALFVFFAVRLLFPNFIQGLIDNMFIPIIFLLFAAYLLTGNSKPDTSEMSSRNRYDTTAELDRMIESEKQEVIF